MITISGIDLDLHKSFVNEFSYSQEATPQVFTPHEDLPIGGAIASGGFRVARGFSGTATIDVQRAAVSNGDASVKAYWLYRDKDYEMISTGAGAAVAVTSTPSLATVTIPAAPANAVWCDVGLQSNTTPPGGPVRINEFLRPRAHTTITFGSKGSWQVKSLSDGSNIGGVTGLNTYVSVAVVSGTGGASADRGITLYTNPTASTPGVEESVFVEAGDVLTLSGWVRVNKAFTMAASIRFFAGGAWVGAMVTGSSVAVAADTWTRLSVTATVPAGAEWVAAQFNGSGASVSWYLDDHIDVSGILLEKSGSMGVYFDGTTKNGIAAPSSVRWEGATNASRSLLYAAAVPGAASIETLGSTLTYSTVAQELIGAALRRDLRRNVSEIFNSSQSILNAGTPGLLAGQLTFLCESLEQALALEGVYQMNGLLTLESSDELNGLTHRAIGQSEITPEQNLGGKLPKWLVAVEFKEQM